MTRSKVFVRGLLIAFLLAGLLAGTLAPTFATVKAAPMKANLRDVVISEVAWGGTAASSSDEWIELYNTTDAAINLSGWILSDSGDMGISLTGIIPANGYYLLESGDDSTISDIPADQIFSGSLSNSDETLTLKDDFLNTIDTANSSGGEWDAGTGSPSYYSMARTNFTSDTSADWSNSAPPFNGKDANGASLNGTPHNSQIDLSLTMTVDNATPSVGSNITFTITIINSGTYSATNVSVKDVFLTAGLTYQSNTTSIGSYNNGTGIWAIGTLANSTTATLSITAQVAAEGVKTNRAEIWTVDQFDPDSTPGNGVTTEDDYALAKATTSGATTLNITNTVNNSNPNVGTNVVFTITVNNPSTNLYDATNVEVAALLPAGLNFISYSSSVGSYNSSSGIWTIGNFAINTSATLNITAKVITTNPPPYSATVSSNEYLDSTATATINNPLSGEADLSLTHDPIVVSTSIADQMALQLRLHNAGPDPATDVQIKDLLPSGLDYVSYASTAGTYTSSTGIWALTALASGSDAVLTINVKVDSGGSSTQNFAEVWLSDQYDPDSIPANGDIGEDDDSSLEVPIADLSLVEKVDVAGSNAIFTITVTNSGPDNATGVKVKTSLPSLISVYTFVSYGSSQGTYDSGTGIWTVGTLTDGASAILTITTTTSGSLLVNWVEVSASDQVDPDSVPNNNSKNEDDDSSAPAADLFLTQSVNNVNPDVNTNVVFTITIGNAGIAGTTNVQVKDLLPSGLTYVSDDGSGTYSSTSGIWDVGTMANGASKTLNITAKVASNGIKTNWAEVWKSDEADPDSTPGNGSTTEDDDAGATITSYRSIIINEIAWEGTAASANDEWIELYNPSNAAINITGWTLKSNSGSLDITLSGTISAGGYFLLEREDNSTVSDVNADQIYAGGSLNLLSDIGEVLTLRDSLAHFIDTANNNGGPWPKGSNSGNRGTMERVGTSTESDTTWVTNLGNPKNGKDTNNGLIYGTPRKANSVGSAPLPTSTPPRTATPKPFGHVVINEFLPRAGFDWNNDGAVNVYDEFIEIENLGPMDADLKNWKLDDELNLGSSPYTLPSMKLKPGERAVFYGSTTHILLDDSGDTVRLINPSGVVIDARGYGPVKYPDQSHCRIPDGVGYWRNPCFPTPGTENALIGSVPASSPNTEKRPPVCLFADTVPDVFRQAECNAFGADIWNRSYWDDQAGQDQFPVPDAFSKWQTLVE